jgi:uroporphyrinogen-III synthase
MPARKAPTLLLTRPEADSRRLAAMVPELPAVISPILRIVPVEHDAARLASAAALVFTSVHAIPSAGPGNGRTAFCVGPRSAAVAREAGFEVIEGPGDAEGLAPLIAASGLAALHPRGVHVARPMPVEGVIVYDQQACALSQQAQELLGQRDPVVVPLLSARSAGLLSQAAAAATAPLWLAAIAPGVLSAWTGPMARSATARHPDAPGVVATIRRLVSGRDKEQW